MLIELPRVVLNLRLLPAHVVEATDVLTDAFLILRQARNLRRRVPNRPVIFGDLLLLIRKLPQPRFAASLNTVLLA